MSTREQNIITEARITLADTDKQRWTDKRLYKLLDDAQQDICKKIPLITRKVTINTASGQEEYRLPSDALKVLTARSGGITLPAISMEELDHNNPSWEDSVGNQYTNLVVNNLTQNVIRPYPLMSPAYSGANLTIKIRYSAKPITLGYVEADMVNNAEVTDTLEELTIEDTWDYGLTQYIISKAFIDYGDESSLGRAQVADSFYSSVVAAAAKLSRKSFSKRVITTGYQGRVARTNLGGSYESSSRGY